MVSRKASRAKPAETRMTMPPATGVVRGCVLRRPSGRSTRPQRIASVRTQGVRSKLIARLTPNSKRSVVMLEIPSSGERRSRSGIGKQSVAELGHQHLDESAGRIVVQGFARFEDVLNNVQFVNTRIPGVSDAWIGGDAPVSGAAERPVNAAVGFQRS